MPSLKVHFQICFDASYVLVSLAISLLYFFKAGIQHFPESQGASDQSEGARKQRPRAEASVFYTSVQTPAVLARPHC